MVQCILELATYNYVVALSPWWTTILYRRVGNLDVYCGGNRPCVCTCMWSVSDIGVFRPRLVHYIETTGQRQVILWGSYSMGIVGVGIQVRIGMG